MGRLSVGNQGLHALPDRTGARRRDRRGRGLRGPLMPALLPAHRDRFTAFDDLVLDAIEFVERRCPRALERFEFAVEDVPPAPPAFWDRGIRLGAYYPARSPLPPRIVLFRMPIVTRAPDPADRAYLVRRVMVEQVAGALAIDPRDIDPHFDD